MKTFKTFVLIVSMYLLTALMVFGQNTTGSLQGTVKDSTGAVVPGASVTITGTNVGFNQTVTADSEGYFRIERLPAGAYTVTVGAISGFAETTLKDVRVNIEKTTLSDVTLGITGGETVVEVSGTDPLGINVDSTDTKVQTSITSELIEKLPSGTSFSSVLKIDPATRGESLTGGFTVDGASKAENSFNIDGQDVTSYRTGTLDSVSNIPTALIKEIQIKTSGFEAEHGGASGGVVVISTKSGSNEFHGEFGTQFVTQKLQPNNRFTPELYQYLNGSQQLYSIQQPKDEGVDFFPTASIGGPVVKDRMWFYGIYSPQLFNRQRTVNYYLPFNDARGPNLIANPAYSAEEYQTSNRYEYAQGRLDYSPFNSLNGFTTFLWNPAIFEGSFPLGAITTNDGPGVQFPYTQKGSELAALKGGRINSNVFNTQLNWTPMANFYFQEDSVMDLSITNRVPMPRMIFLVHSAKDLHLM